MSFFSEASAGTIAVVVAGSLLWIVAGTLRVRARVLEERGPRNGSPISRDSGARRFRMLELAGLVVMLGGLAWYVFES